MASSSARPADADDGGVAPVVANPSATATAEPAATAEPSAGAAEPAASDDAAQLALTAANGSASAELAAPPAPPRARGASGGLAPFASVAYRYLFLGTALTMAGYFMQQVGQGWLIYDLTESPTWLGITSFANGIPMLVLALPAGVLVDRFDRRKVLILAQGLTALVAVVLGALIWTDLVQPWHVVLTAFLSGAIFVLIMPARQALLPMTIERSQMGAAIGLMSAGTNFGRVIGPSLSGVMIALFGIAAAFGAQAVGFLLALICAVVMVVPRPSAHRGQRRSPVQSLLEGLRFVWNDSTVLALLSLQAIPAFLIMPYTQLLPVFARDILHAGPEGLGTLMTAMGVGSIAGAFGVVLLPSRRQGLYLFVSLVTFALLLAAFALSTSLPLSIGIMALIGITQAIYLATNNTLIQLTVPDALLGRVMSVYMTTWGLMPLGSLPQGLLADWFGAPALLTSTGLLSSVIVVLMAVRSPKLRQL